MFDANEFGRLNSLCYKKGDKTYRKHLKKFTFSHPIDEVWKVYKSIRPEEVWTGVMVRFGLQYSRSQNTITYPGDTQYVGIEEGQIIILNLVILNGLLNIAVGHEVKEVNEANKFIRICYLETGASVGSQFIRLSKTPDGSTVVTHETFYKSNSWFRDKILYPGLHGKAITEFHNNVKKNLL